MSGFLRYNFGVALAMRSASGKWAHFRHCGERSDAAIPMWVRTWMGIALMSFVNRLGKRDGIPTV
jgi:hypothetical protein